MGPAFCTSWDVCWVPPGVLYSELDPLLRDSSRLCCVPLMGARELSQQDLARRAAPVCYAIRKARFPSSPLTRTFATENASAQVWPAATGAPVRSRCTRPRDALRANLHRAMLAARSYDARQRPLSPMITSSRGPGQVGCPPSEEEGAEKRCSLFIEDGRTAFMLFLLFLDEFFCNRAARHRSHLGPYRFHANCATRGARYRFT